MISHSETIRMGLQALRANKSRTLLTSLGLLIGNASVIWVVTISLYSRDYIIDQIQRIGSNMIYASYSGGSSTSADATGDFVKVADVEAVREQLGSRVTAVSGVMISQDRMRVEGRQEDISIIGSDEYYAQVRNLERLAGRFVDAGDIANRNRVAMMTEKLARRLYGGQTQAIGQKIKLQGLEFDVIGTFKERTQSFGLSELSDENVVIPVTVLRYFAPIERVDPLYVSAKAPGDVLAVTRTVRTIIEGRHRPGARYTVDNLASILDTARVVATLLTSVLIVISGIALLISGVGIMNIMLVTVTERTREIGLRLAVGASKSNVLAQFLAEAILISMLGGISGILLGIAPALIVRLFAPEFAIPISGISIAVAFTVSLLVGLIFGLLPARRASKLNPTEALRYE
ncbi:MAG: ABC transporter permease [Bryobacteraceae bacterium]